MDNYEGDMDFDLQEAYDEDEEAENYLQEQK